MVHLEVDHTPHHARESLEAVLEGAQLGNHMTVFICIVRQGGLSVSAETDSEHVAEQGLMD